MTAMVVNPPSGAGADRALLGAETKSLALICDPCRDEVVPVEKTVGHDKRRGDDYAWRRKVENVPGQYTVGLVSKGKADRVAVVAEDALIAALRVKAEHPDATITYVRRQNRRGDARHPAHSLTASRR